MMAIIDLASDTLDCAQAVVCLDRSIFAEDSKALLKNLKWVGFDLITLDSWIKPQSKKMVLPSTEWLFLGMEL